MKTIATGWQRRASAIMLGLALVWVAVQPAFANCSWD